jgi:hypothetical protein
VQAVAEEGGLVDPVLALQLLLSPPVARRDDLQHGAAGEGDLLELADGAQGHQAPPVQEGDAVAPLRLVQVMGGHQHRHPIGRHVVDQAPEAAA